MMNTTYATFDSMWLCAVDDVMQNGDFLASRAGGTKERVFYEATLLLPQHAVLRTPSRNMSIVYASAELLWYVREVDTADLILAYAPSYSRFVDENGRAHGHYGYRWRQQDSFCRYNRCQFVSQIDAAIAYLKKSPETRQCVIDIFNAGDLLAGMSGQCKDVPCTLCFQLLIRGGELHWKTMMRSNDLWLGMPYDVFCFTSMQKLIAAAVGVGVGRYCHSVGSMHAYEKDWAKLSSLTPAGDSPGLATTWSGKQIDYRAQVKAALAFERATRTVQGVMPAISSLDGVHPVLRDAALCCGMYWNMDNKDRFIEEITQTPVKERATAFTKKEAKLC